MAERRMFHGAVVGSDDFLDLPIGAQALYFHIGMHADDDGFVNGPRQIMRMLRRPKKELDILVETGFLMDLDGVVVLTHWLVSNTLKSDRLRLPRFPELAAKLFIREDRRYSLTPEGVNLLESRQAALESKGKPKVREGKIREEKISKNKISQESVTEGERIPPLPAVGRNDRGERIPPLRAEGAPVGMTEDAHACEDIEEETIPSGLGQGRETRHYARRATGCYPEDAHAHDEKMLKTMGGKLGKGVVLLSEEQMDDLLRQMGLDAFDKYTEKLANFIISNGAKVNSHYHTILKWWKEDMGIAGGDSG